MKILIVAQSFWPENFRINDLATGLCDRGHEVTVFTGIPNYPQGKFFKGYSLFGPYCENFGKVKVRRVPIISRGKSKGLRLALNYLSFAIMGSILIPFLCREKYDRIFVYQPSPITLGLPAVALKLIKKIPIYFWVTDLWPETLIATGAVKAKWIIKFVEIIVKFIYFHCEKILISCQGFAKKIELLGVSSDKIIYWPQWGEGHFESNIDDSNLSEPLDYPSIIMFAGNIGESQGFDTLLEAAELLKTLNPNIHWVILGEGRNSEWVKKEVVKRKLEHHFHLLGQKPVEAMPAYYAKADALLVSLKADPLFSITVPSKLQSYLASGRPVIASLSGEGAKIIEESGAGFTAQAGDAQSLCNKIISFFELSLKEREAMGHNGLSYFKANFEREKQFNYLEEIMDIWAKKE